jgi:hypothetical protein
LTEDRDRDDDLEPATLAWLCDRWPMLQEEADRQGWRPRLDRAQAALQAGAPPTRICQRLGLSVEESQVEEFRGDSQYVSLSNFRLDPAPSTAYYTCPHHRCGQRRPLSDAGRPPTCVDGAPMIPRTRS